MFVQKKKEELVTLGMNSVNTFENKQAKHTVFTKKNESIEIMQSDIKSIEQPLTTKSKFQQSMYSNNEKLIQQ